MTTAVTVYGADWCGDCRRSKALLDRLNVQYEWIDVETVEGAADRVIEINGGAQSIPVVLFADGQHLTEPADLALHAALRQRGIVD